MKPNNRKKTKMKNLMIVSVLCLTACGSSSHDKKTPPVVPAEEVTPTPTPDVPDATAAMPMPTVLDAAPPVSCVAACEAKYPTPAAANKDLDTLCMLGTCADVCNNLGSPGKNFPPDDTDAGACDTSNSYPISTPSAACSTCLAVTPQCCSIWVSIFGSVEGQALNACALACK